MQTNFALHLPLNNLSFGQCSVAILREIFKRGYEPAIFPIGQVDISCQKISPDFDKWLTRGVQKAPLEHKRSTPIIKLWHIDGSLESLSEKQILYTFYEADAPTPYEVNIAANQKQIFFSSEFSANHFKRQGLTNVSSTPLGFDKDNFYVKNKKFFNDGRIIFNLAGKLERRKQHFKIIRAWVKKYGNNPRYSLQCAVFNPFLKIEDQQNALAQILEGKKYFNVEFLPFMSSNEEYNDYLNSANIIIGMSGGEGFGLPEMQSIALGKHAVMLDAHGYKEFITPENAVLVKPVGKAEIYDGVFFIKGYHLNQGNLCDWSEEDFIVACENAIERVRKNPVNEEGLKLQEKFTYSNLVDSLLGAL